MWAWCGPTRACGRKPRGGTALREAIVILLPEGVTFAFMSSDIDEPVRVSDRGAATRGALLTAARGVFAEAGFAQAAVTDIVAKAGASVGSLYHHFNGKADLYLTLFEEFQNRQQERTREAIHAVRDAGEADPMRLFIAGATAYIDGCLAEREVSRLFISGDGPPGFDRVMQKRLRRWARLNAALFHSPDGAVD